MGRGAQGLTKLGVEPKKPKKVYPRRAIYAGPVTDRLLSRSAAAGETVSVRLETICRRFEYLRAALARDERNQWSAVDWSLFVQSLQEGVGQMEYEAWKHVLFFSQAVAGQFEAMYGVDPSTIATRLRDAGEAVNIAVVDTVDQYWSLSPTLGHVEKLHMLGLVGKEQIKIWAAGVKDRERALAKYNAAVRGDEDDAD